MTIICSKCKIEKDLINYSFQNKEKQQYKKMCKSCVKAYVKEHYLENRDKYVKNAEVWREANKDKYLENQSNYNKIRK